MTPVLINNRKRTIDNPSSYKINGFGNFKNTRFPPNLVGTTPSRTLRALVSKRG